MALGKYPALGVPRRIKEQFRIRSAEFDISANWVKDKQLIKTHVNLAGEPAGKALDLCCGTGQIGRALKKRGWDVHGMDICQVMARSSSRYFPAIGGMAENIPYKSGSFQLVVCRQTFQFLNIKKTLSCIKRALAPGGSFVLSLTVPFSAADKRWLYKIHRVKQPLLLKFYTADDLMKGLKEAGFLIKKIRMLTVRESINRWMNYAPELKLHIREKVISMIKNAPLAYKELHRVEIIDGQVFEDWNWVILKAFLPKKQ